MSNEMDKALGLKALKLLDEKLTEEGISHVTLTMGGGGSMVLQYNYNGKTVDIDALPSDTEVSQDLERISAKVAKELRLNADWLNSYFQTYTVYLPADVKSRLVVTYSGTSLTVKSLGAEDLIIMKLMAGRPKDMSHIRFLMKLSPNLSIVEKRLEELKSLFPKEVGKALERLDDIVDEKK